MGVTIKVRFSERVRPRQVDPGTVTLFRRGSTHAVRASVSYDGQRHRAVLRPASALVHRTSYRVVVASAIRDLAGNRLDQDPARPGPQRAVLRFRTR